MNQIAQNLGCPELTVVLMVVKTVVMTVALIAVPTVETTVVPFVVKIVAMIVTALMISMKEVALEANQPMALKAWMALMMA